MKEKKKIVATKSTPAISPKEARAAAADEFKLIPRAELHPDPDQPRQTFDEASLKELADSIGQQGIVQPLIVRLVPAAFKVIEPDLTSIDYRLLKRTAGDWQPLDCCDEKNFQSLHEVWAGNFGGLGTAQDYLDRYVIVAGERRWRASELAGLGELPCIVRDLDAHKVFAQQFIENEQRVNISALEESEALQKALEKRKAESGSFSVEDLARELGLSRAGLYQRLALTRLHPPVRAALLAGKISTSAAGIVAIVPQPAAQERLLKEITNENHWKFPFSVREVQALVDDDYCRQLSAAPFDPQATLYSAAGGQLDACTACPHRSGNLVDQFPELAKRPNVCTQPDCFAAKCKAHWLAQSQDLAQRGQTVLTEKEFKRVKAEYIEADKHCWLWSDANGSPAGVLGKHAPEPVHVASAEGIKKYFKLTAIPAASKAAKLKLRQAEAEKTQTPEQKAEAALERAKQEDLKLRRNEFLKAQLPVLAKLLGKLKSDAAWKLANELMEHMDGYLDQDIEAGLLDAAIKDPQTRVLGRLFADEENRPLTSGGNWEERVLKLWKQVGLDLKRAFEAGEKATQKTLALPPKKPEQGNLLKIKAHAGPKTKGKK